MTSNMSAIPQVVPFIMELNDGDETKYKITIDDLTYTFYCVPLKHYMQEPHQCVQHALTVRDVIERETDDVDLQGKLMTKLYPKTLSIIERAFWDNLEDYNEMDEDSISNWELKVHD